MVDLGLIGETDEEEFIDPEQPRDGCWNGEKDGKAYVGEELHQEKESKHRFEWLDSVRRYLRK